MLTTTLAVPAPAKPLSDSWLSVELVAIRLTVSPRTVWRMVVIGQLPAPVKFSRKISRWRWADVVDALVRLKERRDREAVLAEDEAGGGAVRAEVDAALAELGRGGAPG